MLTPRPYQTEACEAVERHYAKGTQRTAVVMATGLGKTHVLAEVIKRRRDAGDTRRSLILAHRTELIEAAAQKVRDVMPELRKRVGIVKGNRNETLGDIVVASVQSLVSEKRRLMLRDVGFVIIDEAHHAAASSYVNVLRHFGCYTDGSGVQALGLTATMVRSDNLALGDVWQTIAYTRDTAFGVREGYLVRPKAVHVRVDDLDLGAVKTSRGDYDAKALGAAIEDSLAPKAIVRALREHAVRGDGTLRRTVLFAPLVSTAVAICDELCADGLRAVVVSGTTPSAERAEAQAKLARGELDVLCNAMLFTEGTDIPSIECIVIARPTKSRGLFVQMIGRGLRPSPATGKTDCLVLDVVGVSRQHGIAAPIELFGDDGLGVARVPREDDELPEETDLDPLLDGPADLGLLGLPDEVYGRDGRLVAEVIDLFEASRSAWQQTAGGVWYLTGGDRYLVVLPAPGGGGGFDVVTLHREIVGVSRWVVRDVSELSYAMQWAEGDITPEERTLARKARSWRRESPTEKQLWKARREGVEIIDGMTRGEISSAIDCRVASRRIDPYVPDYAKAQVRV